MEHKHIVILFGITMGNAEHVAHDLTAALTEHGIAASAHSMEDTDLALFESAPDVIICMATSGRCDRPRDVESFYQALEERAPDLHGIRFAVCALGDRNRAPLSNATGGGFARLFARLGATDVVTPFTFDDPCPGAIADAQRWALTFAAERHAVE
jgi:MioC protein